MKPLSPAFNCATAWHHGFSTFALLLFVLAIDEARQRREKERKRRRRAFAKPQYRPAPCPAPHPF
jgi:hypothetical protein